jgi:hypothetical protein
MDIISLPFNSNKKFKLCCSLIILFKSLICLIKKLREDNSMLNETQVLTFIKTKLASPFIPLELDDEQILAIVRQQTIPLFSRYIPDVNEIKIDTNDEEVKTDVENVFLILDPDGLPIYFVKKVYFDQGGMIMAGHPIIGLMGGGLESVVDFVLKVEESMSAHHYGLFNYTIQWIKPNKLRIMPAPGGYINVVYEREHHPDFHTIPIEYKTHFLNLAYADVAEVLADIRRQFREIHTPFGTIELNPEVLEDRARQIRDQYIEELKQFNPSIIIDRGTA